MQICIQAVRPINDRNHNDKLICDWPIASAEVQHSKNSNKRETQSAYLSLQKLIQPLPRRSEQETTFSTERIETRRFRHAKLRHSIRHPLALNSYQPEKADTIASKTNRVKVTISWQRQRDTPDQAQAHR